MNRKINSQQGFTTFLFLVIVVGILMLIAGGYFIGRSTQDSSNPVKQQNDQDKTRISFQDILSKNCQKIQINANITMDSIEQDKLPVKLDEKIIELDPKNNKRVYCLYGNPGKQFVSIDYGISNQGNPLALYIYDDKSEELGHGGPPFLNFYGVEFKKNADLRLGGYVEFPEGGDALISESGVSIRGVRTLRLGTGESIYLSTSNHVIDAKDPKLLDIFKNYSKPSTISPGEEALDGSKSNELNEKISKLLSNPDNLTKSQKEAIKIVEDALNSVSIK